MVSLMQFSNDLLTKRIHIYQYLHDLLTQLRARYHM